MIKWSVKTSPGSVTMYDGGPGNRAGILTIPGDHTGCAYRQRYMGETSVRPETERIITASGPRSSARRAGLSIKHCRPAGRLAGQTRRGSASRHDDDDLEDVVNHATSLAPPTTQTGIRMTASATCRAVCRSARFVPSADRYVLVDGRGAGREQTL